MLFEKMLSCQKLECDVKELTAKNEPPEFPLCRAVSAAREATGPLEFELGLGAGGWGWGIIEML